MRADDKVDLGEGQREGGLGHIRPYGIPGPRALNTEHCTLKKTLEQSSRVFFAEREAQSTRSPPQKNRATVPGPVWEPIVVPT